MALLEVSLGWTLWFQNFTPFPVVYVCVYMHYLGIKMLQSHVRVNDSRLSVMTVMESNLKL